MTYARIADRTVADEYFAVTDQIETLYTTRLPEDAEGPNMRRLRTEHTKMLGNGYCTRPEQLDCHFETICETCVHFAVTLEFAPHPATPTRPRHRTRPTPTSRPLQRPPRTTPPRQQRMTLAPHDEATLDRITGIMPVRGRG